jgi:hypothetical protein
MVNNGFFFNKSLLAFSHEAYSVEIGETNPG